MNAINFEVYTKNPQTGEEGWEIKFPTIYAETKKEAREILKTDYPNFDVVILHNYSVDLNTLPPTHIDVIAYKSGKKYRDTTPHDRYN